MKKFDKNFNLIIIGQIISLFGNTILRFALSMTVLDKTGSIALFATILAVSMIPTVLLSAFGGILADRINKRNIMVCLDFCTSLLIFLFILYFHLSGSIFSIGVIMLLLSIIQSFYQPSVQSSIPLLVEEKSLMTANGLVIQVNALANLLGPIIGGFLYGFLGLYPILFTSGICFLASAIMEIFIHIPHTKRKKEISIWKTIQTDLKEAGHFLWKEQKNVLKLLAVIAGINFFLSAMIMIGLPYMIKILLKFNNQWYGVIEAALGIGSILGGLTAGLLAKKIPFKKSYLLLLGASIFLLPIGIAIIGTKWAYLSYFTILISSILVMACATLFSIYGQTVMQKLTPVHLLGKVASVVTVISMCALPLGQALYGGLFDWAKGNAFVIVFLSAFICIIISLISKKFLCKIEEK